MSHFLVRASYTAESWAALVSRPVNREHELQAAASGFGVKLVSFYFAFGEHDANAILEADDQKSAMGFLMNVAASGGVRGLETTVLVTSEDAMDAMNAARSNSGAYAPPRVDELVQEIHNSPQNFKP